MAEPVEASRDATLDAHAGAVLAGAAAVVGGAAVVSVVEVVGATVVVVVEVERLRSAAVRDAFAVLEGAGPAAQADTETPNRAASATIRSGFGLIGWETVLGHLGSRSLRKRAGSIVVLLGLLMVAGCASPAVLAGTKTRGTPTTTTSTTSTTTTTTVPPTTTTTVPPFSSSVSPVTAAQLGATWHDGCPVDPSQLSAIEMTYWGFDDQAHTGTMVVNTSVVSSVIQVFSTLYADRFPLQEMVPESAYGGDDNAAAAADDTSGFNCRDAVAPGPPQWSVHAYGEAIDVNDVQNPYIDGSTIIPPAGAAYEDRTDVRPGMAVPGGVLVDAFAAVGWYWGGRWTDAPDYQHFSLTGG